MKQIIWYFIGVAIGCLLGFWLSEKHTDATIRDIQEVAHQYYDERLADPHHCISVCEKEFAKYGC